MSEGEKRIEVKVGLFVLLGIIAVVGVVLVLGQKRHVFEKHVRVYSVFTEVGGLVSGAPVQIAGVSVGTVSNIAFDRSGPRPQIRVDMEISESAVDLVRADSVARISSHGLLGDKLIDISAGSGSAPEIASGGLVASAPPPDIDRMIATAGQVMEKLDRVAGHAATFTEELSSPRNLAELRGSLAAMHALLEATAHGRGLAHAIFYDHRSARALTSIATGIDELVGRVNHAVAGLQPIFDATDREGQQLINNISRAAHGVDELAGEVRSSKLVSNLDRASGDLAQVTSQLRHGGGTLGALIQDPSIYEQLVTILGGVGRSRILRALVRYAISKSDTKEAKQLKPKEEQPPQPDNRAATPPGRREGKR